MKSLYFFVTSTFLLLGSVAQDSLQLSISQLPPCALSCLVNSIPVSTCSATNTTCICFDDSLQVPLTLCTLASCTVKEALLAKNISATICGLPVRDQRAFYNAVSSSFATISGLAIVLRIISKYITQSNQSNFWFDDWFILITFFSGIPGSVLNVHGLTANGLGKDIYTIPSKQITDFVHVFYAMEIMYFAQVSLLKLSILFFYLRIFPGTGVRHLIWMTIVVTAFTGTVFVILAIFQCLPISYYWKRWDGEHEGSCFDVNAMAFGNAGISIILDVWMLGLALSQIYHLNLHWKKKVGVALMFNVGLFVTVVSIVRLGGLVTFADSINPTWQNLPTGLFSTIEINVGIICACMPSLRLLLVKAFPKILGTNNTKLSSPPSRNVLNNKRKQMAGIVTTKPRRVGVLYSPSYTTKHHAGWDDDKEQLDHLENADAEFIKLRARGSEMWGGDDLYDATDARSLPARSSRGSMPVP